MSHPRCIALAGFDSRRGSSLSERLFRWQPAPRLLRLDGGGEAAGDAEESESLLIDWSEPDSDEALCDAFAKYSVDVLVHMGSPGFPMPFEEADPEFELRRIRVLLKAAERSSLKRLVVGSSTLLYGAMPDNPNFLTESHPLRGHPHANWMEARIQAEQSVQEFAQRHPQTEVTVLRSCWSLGPGVSSPVSRFFSEASVPTCLGYDPLLQFIHEEDLLSVFEKAIGESHPGTFNIVARGVLPLSTLLALAGKTRWPLPVMMLDRWPGSWPWGSSSGAPSTFYDFLRYLWVAAGESGWSEFGEPGYTSREAWISFVSSERLNDYRRGGKSSSGSGAER